MSDAADSMAARVARLLGVAVSGARRVRGGDLSTVWRLALADGGSVVAKAASTAGAEAGMLRRLGAAGIPAPAVRAACGDLLVMADLGPDDGPQTAWADLGAVLRRLHGLRGDRYGWPHDHAFGPVPIANAATDDWPAFWAERRLLPFCPALPPGLARQVAALAARLPELLPRRPPAALLHGDLWAGNILARGGRVTGLIDPACYHGDAEVDLAMLRLFSAPGPAFFAALGPAAPGADARRPIYQLWPALVHLRLFGAGYRGLVERCLRAAG